jgi:hypothetical protein
MVQRFAAQSAVNPGVPSGYPLAYAENSGLYIHARNPFVISLHLYIQNRKPFVMNKSWYMPKEGDSARLNQALQTSRFVYTLSEPLCYQPAFVYTKQQALCYEQIMVYAQGGGFRSPEPGATNVPVCIYTLGTPLL